MEF
ncbi:hypothetical protein YPPY66_0883, partial [Yersinia pestis PY-66]|jgi:guanylate kinase